MGKQIDWSGYDNWLNKDNPHENYIEEDENPYCSLCTETASRHEISCHKDTEQGEYCYCYNSDCDNPEPK